MITEMEYGKTNWGKAWLEGLLEGVKAKQLSQGMSYAKNGGVQTLDVNSKGTVEAIVEGFGASNYYQQIQWIPFTVTQKEAWLSYFKSNPNSLTSLLNQTLSEAILVFGDSIQASVLPSNLKNWNMTCSCAEQKLPCKHVIAVLFVLSTQIEQNPLLLFELSGLNLSKELQENTAKDAAIEQWTNGLSANYTSKTINLSIAKLLNKKLI